jgi:titin
LQYYSPSTGGWAELPTVLVPIHDRCPTNALLSRLLGRGATAHRQQRPVSRHRARLGIEALEGRLAPATFTVTSAADTGLGSLRAAIFAANAHPGADTITFHVGGGGAQPILLNSALPVLTGPTSIAGNTQPGFAGTPLIDLFGLNAGAGASGLTLAAGAGGSSVRGLVINRFGGSGLRILANNCSVQGCFIGTNPDGTSAQPNGEGVVISGAAMGNLIGGASASAGNVISGNVGAGVVIAGSAVRNNLVEGNAIGTNAARTGAVANGEGVLIAARAHNDVVGGVGGQANLISGNANDGVHLDGPGTTANLVRGNSIGLNGAGSAALGNNYGVAIRNGARANTILANTVSGNSSAGVLVTDAGTSANLLAGNKVGTNAAGTAAVANDTGGILRGGATGNTVAGNLLSGNTNDGLEIQDTGTTHNVARGNKIGTNAAGTAALANGSFGVLVLGGATKNVIGGTAAATRNIVSGNVSTGVYILNLGTDGNVVEGNFIGTNAAGTAAVPNGDGIFVNDQAMNTRIGGAVPGARNVISGNTAHGVRIQTNNCSVQGCFIGTNAAGTAALANLLDGVIVAEASALIGGSTALARNVISGNGEAGVAILTSSGANCKVQGNFIGTNAAGTGGLGNGLHGVVIFNGAHDNQIAGNRIAFNGGAGVLVGSDAGNGFISDAGTGNAVEGNSIFGNAGLGIDLGAFGSVTANDADDFDSGANDLQNFPVLAQAVSLAGAGTYVAGSLNGFSFGFGQSYRIEFFSDPAPDPSGHGEGRVFLGALTVAIPAGSNKVSFSTVLPVVAARGSVVTATATNSFGDTSEFALNVTVT